MGQIHVYAISDVGCRRRENQDTFLVNNMVEKSWLELILPTTGLYFSHHGLLCAVADGLGGHRGGALASQLVLQALATKVFNLGGLADYAAAQAYFAKYIQRLHHSVQEQSLEDPQLAGMGTTLTGLYLGQNFGLFFHAGDSRLYRFRGDFLLQITRDHSPQGLSLSLSEQFATYGSSIITNCIGGGPGSHCQPDLGKIALQRGELLLICSDGLSDMLPVETMEEILCRREGPRIAARSLLKAAKRAGGDDNIALILIERT
ncbi:MAG: serine/threonine-protein phosphatase [Firmicutes bacterium]|nr:serine/threonine-protein phosphatase [Bacillota bacterium]